LAFLSLSRVSAATGSFLNQVWRVDVISTDTRIKVNI
jgi:hypothetical protein